jgi:SAM-dependent methyltransferase
VPDLRAALAHRARIGAATARDAVDAAQRLRARGSTPLRPPRRLLGGDYDYFERVGEEFLGHFVDLGGLKPSDRVLDVGCGPGRMAVPLTRYLDSAGSYEGFDVVPREVEWCRRRITPRHPSFRFQVADVRNPRYNPHGAMPASEYRFPFPDASFDFAFATSVLTHLREPDAANYLREIGRVLRPGGRCMVTFFLWNAETRRDAAEGRSHYAFAHADGHARYESLDSPEAAVAYDESWVHDRYFAAGMGIEELRYGQWCGREPALTWQDLIVGGRPG